MVQEINMYSIIDLETTGGKYKKEGITEIAIYRFDGKNVIDSFISLVNPEKTIHPFVEKLTGITQSLVKDAPRFYQIAKKIIEINLNQLF